MSAIDRLDEIEARAAAATAGPWEAFEDVGQGLDDWSWTVRGATGVVAEVVDDRDYDQVDSDIEFIAHARTDVPALVRALREVLALRYASDDGTEWEHVPGCDGQWTCPACASLDGPVTSPVPTHSRYYPRTPGRLDPGVLPWVSMADALGRSESLRSNYGTGGGPAARGVRTAGHPAPTVTSKVDRNLWIPTPAVRGDTSWVERRPSPTIVGSFAPDVVAAPGWRKPGDGPRQKAPGSVRVTIKEASVLQGFRADHPWKGSRSAQFLQCGNAVPPPLAAAVARAAMEPIMT